MKRSYPRMVLAGSGGGSGKTMLALGLLSHCRHNGLQVVGFKKGPDFIDTAWLAEAAQSPAHNLDVYLMGEQQVYASFLRHGGRADLSVIEGNRGIFDGMDASGTYSTAELAKLLHAPLFLILDATKVTRTLAAFVLGCLHLDPSLQLAGVILNRIAGGRHERVTRRAIEEATGVPVLGAIPKLSPVQLLPERHLGLVTPGDHGKILSVCEELRRVVRQSVDVDAMIAVARNSPNLPPGVVYEPGFPATTHRVRIGYFQDTAFSFYYPENLEALRRAGAKLIVISPLSDQHLPELDALYIGGGFPEVHAETISLNRSLLQELKNAADRDLPIYAECGGLIFLSRRLRYGNESFPMAGVLPFEIDMKARPVGHGYCEFEIDQPNPFFPLRCRIRGHEFHYSTVVRGLEQVKTVYRVFRGKGYRNGREGFLCGRVLASYFHLHALSLPHWGEWMVRAARTFQKEKLTRTILTS